MPPFASVASGWMPLSPLRPRSWVQLMVIPTIAQLVPMKCRGAWGVGRGLHT